MYLRLIYSVRMKPAVHIDAYINCKTPLSRIDDIYIITSHGDEKKKGCGISTSNREIMLISLLCDAFICIKAGDKKG